MDYDTYGSSAVELAIELANADRTDAGWARDFLVAHDEWFTPGTPLQLPPGETHKAGATAELVRAVTPDSAALAGRADVSWTLPGDRFRLDAEYLAVGEGFAATANPRLSGGSMNELRLGAELRVTDDASVRLHHERQHFGRYDVDRSATTLQAEQKVAGRMLTTSGGITSDAAGVGSSTSATARARARSGVLVSTQIRSA